MGIRLVASIVSLAVCWLIAGVVFSLVVQGPGAFLGWLIWGGAVCFIAWLLVGLPLVAAGDHIFRLPAPIFVLGVGFAGALVMALPSLIGVLTNNFGAAGRVVFTADRTWWGFEAGAFAIGAASAWGYRRLLQRSSRGDARTARSNAHARM